jgi:lipopolysaccharide export system protein LptC
VASLVGLIVFPFINPFRDASVQVGLVRLDGTRVTMENPRLSGHRKDNSPYEVTAVSAIQDIRKPTIIELNGMTARLSSPDQGVMNLTAAAAVFDSAREQLQLTRDVVVRTQSGQEARMASAEVDFKAGTVKSRGGVAIALPDLAITADAMDVSDSGSTVTFSGRVNAVLTQKDGPSAPAALPPESSASALPDQRAMRPGVAPERPAAAAAVIDPATGQLSRPAP